MEEAAPGKYIAGPPSEKGCQKCHSVIKSVIVSVPKWTAKIDREEALNGPLRRSAKGVQPDTQR